MKKDSCLTFILSILMFNAYSQVEKSTKQFGVSVLPIFDVFNMLPDYKLAGVATQGNIGVFLEKNFSMGINPYYAKVTNTYFFPKDSSTKQKQDMTFYGLNAFCRYYFITNEKWAFYAQGSLGFGVVVQQTDVIEPIHYVKSHTKLPVFTYFIGAGLNYYITKNLTMEFNLPFLYTKFISTNPDDVGFRTLIPTFGVQYYLK